MGVMEGGWNILRKLLGGAEGSRTKESRGWEDHIQLEISKGKLTVSLAKYQVLA